MAKEAGRNPDELEVSIFGQGPDEGELKRARDAGITRIVFGLPPAEADQVLPLLDRYAELARQVG